MKHRRRGNAAAGCLLLIVFIGLAAIQFGGCSPEPVKRDAAAFEVGRESGNSFGRDLAFDYADEPQRDFVRQLASYRSLHVEGKTMSREQRESFREGFEAGLVDGYREGREILVRVATEQTDD